MEKTVCIIDTNQFIDCPEVMDYAVSKGYKIYIPNAVFKEIDKVLVEKIFSDDYIKKIRKAKTIIEKNEGKYINAKSLLKESTDFADPKILQYILELMSDRNIEQIIVYTADSDLSEDINKRISGLKSIKHNCTVEAKNFKNAEQKNLTASGDKKSKEKPDSTNDKKSKGKSDFTKKNTANKQKKFIIHKPDGMFVWRNDSFFLENSENVFSMCTEPSSVPTLSGNKNVLKFWLWYAVSGDWIKLYKDVDIKKGSKVSINFMTLDNSCNLFVGLELYMNGTDKKQSSKFITIKHEGKWHTITMIADDDYNDVNFAIKVQKDSSLKNDFNGTAGYIESFTITE